MGPTFFERSKQIANNFIQSVLFIDDELYSDQGNINNRLDGQELVKVFSKEKKLCALNNPQNESDFDDIIEVARLADITVLDWRMNLAKRANDNLNEEEDEENDDPRGTFTMKLIKQLLQANNRELKLILIYTGEPILTQIVDRIFEGLEDLNVVRLSNNIIGKSNFRIIVAGKPSLEGRLNHNPELKSWILQYAQLPDFLLSEFTKMTEGVVSNVALGAITSLRNNCFKILSVFNKDIDPAFLSHRAMLPIVDDAGDLIKESLMTSFKAILDYENLEALCSFQLISKWIDDNDFSNKTIRISKKDFTITKREIKQWQKSGFIEAFKNIWADKFPQNPVDPSELDKMYRELHKTSLKYFLPDGLSQERIEEDFSILTHHKSNFAAPSYTPRLSLGTIIKGLKSGKYWVCIQQRCDSVRIKEDDVRRFLFLPLIEVTVGKKFNFLITDNLNIVRLLVDYDTHKLRTIKFMASRDEAVYARRFGASKRYFFQPLYYKGHTKYDSKNDESFLWIMDLKDNHSQRIANIYASKLSRVGLDESEWLRRWSGN